MVLYSKVLAEVLSDIISLFLFIFITESKNSSEMLGLTQAIWAGRILLALFMMASTLDDELEGLGIISSSNCGT